MDSKENLVLTTKPGSCCHFVERFPHGAYEIGLRIDWSDLDRNGDPTLDADFFSPGDTKPRQEHLFKRAHHTRKRLDDGLWIYDFALDDLRLRLQFLLTRQRTIMGVARIVRPEPDSNQAPQ